MSYKHIYTVLSDGDPNKWRVIKMDRDFDKEGEYNVNFVPSPSGGFLTCDCFASNKATCRHRQMVTLFNEQRLVNSRRAYDFDKKRWIAQPTLEA